MPLAPEWQHPFVNVFKICDVDTMREFETRGDVTEHMDKIIGKKVFKVRGVIPAGNYLRVPRSKLQSLGLTGRILYIQLKVTPVKVFVIHIEAVTEDNNAHRVSVSNMYSQESLKRKSNGVQLPFPRTSHRWCVLAVDMWAALRGFTTSPFAAIKSVQLCSWLTVRTMFTSDYKFSLETLPSDMALSHALDTGIFELIWLPAEPLDAPTMDFLPPPKRLFGPTRRRTLDRDTSPRAASGRPASASAAPSTSAGAAPSGRSSHSRSKAAGTAVTSGLTAGTATAAASSGRSPSARSKMTSSARASSGGGGGATVASGSASVAVRRSSGAGAGASSGGGGASRRRSGGSGSRGGSGGGGSGGDDDRLADQAGTSGSGFSSSNGIIQEEGEGEYDSDFDSDDDANDADTPLPPSPVRSLTFKQPPPQPDAHPRHHHYSIRPTLPISPVAAAAAARRVTAANISSGTAADAIVGAAAVPARPGDRSPSRFPARTPALTYTPMLTNVPAPGGGSTLALMAPPSRRRPLSASVPAATISTAALTQSPGLVPDPALQLVRMNAYSGEFLRCLVWIPRSDEVAFAAASVVVIMNVADSPPLAPAAVAAAAARPGAPAPEPGRQRFLLGHTAFVCALAVASHGELLVSAQEGKEATVRLWDVASCACLAILNAHASGLSCVDISPDVRAVAAVGLDAHGRQTIALWNIAEMRNPHRRIDLVTRHATEFNIKVLRFSAYQEDHLVTAGRDSIRIYRLKGGQLRGTSVRLTPLEKRVTSHIGGVSAALGPNIFTDIAFEAGVGVYGADAFKVYVSSASGALFQVDYTTRQLDCIFQLHSAAINCLLVADGLAITGADDRLLRAWPLDFKDYLLEAEHEGSVTGLALSPDALRVAIGTENGTLGCLHIPNHAYTTLLRSHSAAVNAVAVDPNRDHYCTVSSDGTLRIWHLLTHQQLYEFDAPGEAVTCIAYHPLPTHHELAAGFANGRMRVFDVASTTLIQEQQQHRAAVAELVFSPAGDRLFSGGMDGALVMYDVQRLYAPTQYLSAGVRDIKVCVAVSPSGAYFASLIRDPYRGITSLLLFHGSSLDPFMRIETDVEAYVKLAFSSDNKELWALTTERRLDRYELADGNLVQQIWDVSPLDLTTLAMDPVGRYVLTAGNDGLVRLWARVALASLRPRETPPHQSFLGHPSTVLGAAFHRGHLLTVGDAECICVWRVTADFHAHPHLLAAQAARTAAALRLAALPPQLRPPDAPSLPAASSPGAIASLFAYPAAAAGAGAGAGATSPGAVALLDPHDPLSRATPGTALGAVADATDHRLTARAAALGLAPLPHGTILIPTGGDTLAAAALSAFSPPRSVPPGPLQAVQPQQQLYYVPQPGASPGSPSVVVSSSPSAAAAFNAAAAAFATARISSPAVAAAGTSGGGGVGVAGTIVGAPSFAPKPVPPPPPPPQRPAPPPPPPPPPPPHPSSPSVAAQWAAVGGAAAASQPPATPGAGSSRIPHQTHTLAQLQQVTQELQAPQPPPTPSFLAPQPPPPPPACDWLLGYTPTGCANVAWRPETGLFAYTVEDMVVLEHLATRHQRFLRGHTRPLSCLAAAPDGRLLAVAPAAPEPYVVEPSSEAVALAVPCTTAPFADVVVWETATGRERWRLRYHTKAVQFLTFSPDGRWLLSLGREPERSVVLWDVVSGQLVAAGRTEQLPVTADWLWGGEHPAFATVGPAGLNLWTLQDSFLEQRSVPLSDQETTVPCTALAVDPAGALLVAEAPSSSSLGANQGGFGDGGDPRVAVWHVEVAAAIAGGDATMAQVATLPGDARVTALAAGHNHALLATERGLVVRFRRSTLSGTWVEEASVQLDGRVLVLCGEPSMADAVAATSTSTIWFVGMQDASAVPIVCGQPAPVTALVPAPHDPRVMASTSQDGLLRMWRLGPEDAEPVIELQSSVPCTAAAFVLRSLPPPPPASAGSLSPDDLLFTRTSPFADLSQPVDPAAAGTAASAAGTGLQPQLQALLLGGYGDGSLRLFAVEPTVELQWALARHPAPVVGVVAHPLRPLALTASSDGSIAITDLVTTRLISYITAFTGLGPASAGGSPTASPSRARAGRGTGGASPPRKSPRSPTAARASTSSPTKSPRQQQQQQQQQPSLPRPGSGPMQAFAVSPGVGASVAAAAWRDRFVVFAAPWEDPTCTPISAYDCPPSDLTRSPADGRLRGPPETPALLSFVGGATKLIAYSSPLLLGVVLVYDYRLGVVVRKVTIPQMIRSMALSPDGGALVLGSSERTVYFVHLATGRHQALPGHTGPVVAVGFSADGSHAVTAAGNVLMVWAAAEVLLKLDPAPPPPRQTLFEF